jgi:cation:H+ antiporter
MTLAAALVFVSGNDRLFNGEAVDVFTRTDGIALLGFFVIFLFYIRALISTDPPPIDENHTKSLRPPVAFALILGGLTGLVLGGKLLVDNAVILAELAGLSEAVIGLTIVAIGTSLPELATSIVAALKKEVDIAIGNIVGSNIFNLFWILGVTSVIAPLPAPEGFLFDASVALIASVILFLALFVGTKRQIDRSQGWLFLGIYIFYIGYLVM